MPTRSTSRTTELRRRTALHAIATVVVVAVATIAVGVLPGWGLGASRSAGEEAATDQDRHPRETAEEVCEAMVRDSVIAAAGRRLAEPRRGVWDGKTRYMCTYSFGSQGSVIATVDVFPSHAAAKRAFTEQRGAVPKRVTLFGMGQRAFRDGQTRIVAQKDRFLLTVDGSTLTRAVHPSSTTWSTTRAIFDCW